jgi:cholesterol oxidase
MAPLERRALDFRERMRGHIALRDLSDMTDENADRTGWTRLEMRLNMHVADVPRFWSEAEHRGESTGTIICPGLGGELAVRSGHFNLLDSDHGPGHQHMTYLMQFSDRLGRPVTLTGYKELITGGDDIWEETTLLLTQLHRGWLEADDDWTRDVIGSGLLRIRLVDFLHQLTTFRPGPHDSPLGAVVAMTTFGPSFVGRLARIYLASRSESGPRSSTRT